MSFPSLTSSFIRLTMGIVLTVLLAVSGFTVVQAKLYSCVSSSGTTIYTDSPAQLEDCTPVSVDHLYQSPVPEGLSTSSPTESLNQEESPASNSRPSPPNLSIEKKSKSVRPDDHSGSGHPIEQQTCVSSLNPLNPLLNRPCSQKGESRNERRSVPE